MVAVSLAVFLVGLAVLVKASDVMVDNAVLLAKRLNVSELIISLTLISIGTSLPELSSSLAAAKVGSGGLIMGTIIGSNITNICIVIGLSAMFGKVEIDQKILREDGIFLLMTLFLFSVIIADGVITPIEGGLLLLFYAIYLGFIIKKKSEFGQNASIREFTTKIFRIDYIGPVLRGKQLIFVTNTAWKPMRRKTKQIMIIPCTKFQKLKRFNVT